MKLYPDGNFVSSRKPDDVPAFDREMIHPLGQTLSKTKTAAHS